MPLNLDPIKNFVEGEMVDTILVERPGEGYRDGTMNDLTGVVTEPDPTIIYNDVGLILPVTADPSDEPEGSGEASYTRFTLMLPLTCPELKINDIVTLTNCVRDAANNDTVFYVEGVDHSTFAVVRQALVSKRDFAGNI